MQLERSHDPMDPSKQIQGESSRRKPPRRITCRVADQIHLTHAPSLAPVPPSGTAYSSPSPSRLPTARADMASSTPSSSTPRERRVKRCSPSFNSLLTRASAMHPSRKIESRNQCSTLRANGMMRLSFLRVKNEEFPWKLRETEARVEN